LSSRERPKRAPAVAGMFYPDNPTELRNLIDESFRDRRYGPGKSPPSDHKRRIYGVVSPHAGYFYSGTVAANGFLEISSLDFKDVVIVGPNHYGIGNGVALMREGVWETPLGEVEINSQLAEEIASRSALTDFSDTSHSKDHCLEVQIPFLQFIRKEIRIVPIILIKQDIDTAFDLGKAIADTVIERGIDSTLLIASSDFTHYEPNEEAHRKDGELIKAILALDVYKFYSVLERLDVSACGYGAIASIMVAAKSLGAKKGELLRYATSGDVTGDKSAVVGYSSIVFV
jgi:MEMO1 family protein